MLKINVEDKLIKRNINFVLQSVSKERADLNYLQCNKMLPHLTLTESK